MMCLPRAVDLNRTVLETTAIETYGDWWMGIVRDRDHKSGETRLRLERLVKNDSGVDMPHVWRVRPDFWQRERGAVSTLKRGGGAPAPETLPISNRFTPREYIDVRCDGKRHVAAVRLQKPSGQCIRLYHWDPDTDAVRQKFTTGQSWNKLAQVASRKLGV